MTVPIRKLVLEISFFLIFFQHELPRTCNYSTCNKKTYEIRALPGPLLFNRIFAYSFFLFLI